MIFFIFPLFFVAVFGYDKYVECDLYSQRYPNLTLTKVYSENTTKTCDDICIEYLCPVKFFDKHNNEKVYAMGSGCREDVIKNCEFYIDFGINHHIYKNHYIYACISLETARKNDPNYAFGWGDHFSDILYEPEVDGVQTFNESLNTIYPVTEDSTTTSPIETSTSTTTSTSNTQTTTPTSTSTSTTTTNSTTTCDCNINNSEQSKFSTLLFAFILSVLLF